MPNDKWAMYDSENIVIFTEYLQNTQEITYKENNKIINYK